MKRINILPLCASSTDYNQSIIAVLNDDKNEFWSSKGHENNIGATEFLVFKTNNPSIITKINLKFFYAHWLLNKIFISKRIKILFGNNSNEYYFESKEIQIENNLDEEYSISITLNDNIWVCNYIKILFIDKVNIQETDNLYYVAVEKINCYGINVNETIPLNLYKQIIDGTNNFYEKKALEISNNKENLDEYTNYRIRNSFDNDLKNENIKINFQKIVSQDNSNLEILLDFITNNIEILFLKEFIKYLYTNKKLSIEYFEYLSKKSNEREYLHEMETILFFKIYLPDEKNELKKHLNCFHTKFSYLTISNYFFKKLFKHLKIKNEMRLFLVTISNIYFF